MKEEKSRAKGGHIEMTKRSPVGLGGNGFVRGIGRRNRKETHGYNGLDAQQRGKSLEGY